MIKKTFIKYLLSGGTNTLISLAIFTIMVHFGVNYLFASSFVYIYGIIQGYVFNCKFVFHTQVIWQGLLRYSGVFAISFILNLILMYIGVDIFHLQKLVSQIIVTGMLTILNYQLIKLFVFEKKIEDSNV